MAGFFCFKALTGVRGNAFDPYPVFKLITQKNFGRKFPVSAILLPKDEDTRCNIYPCSAGLGVTEKSWPDDFGVSSWPDN